MSARHPSLVVIAGPNGAGKTTAAPSLLRDQFAVSEYVNADIIAAGLSGYDPDRSAIAAGRVMLARMKQLAAQRASFAFESTLASRSFIPWIKELRSTGYELHLVFLWLPDAEMALARVKERVRAGGHDVPEPTVRRRYERGLRNFWNLYVPLAKSWIVCDSSASPGPRVIASGKQDRTAEVFDVSTWKAIQESARQD